MTLFSLLFVVSVITGIVSLVSGVYVLVQMFKKAGVPMGLMGLLTCLVGAYVWGWIKAGELKLTKIMLAWTATIVISVLANLVAGGFIAAQNTAELQKAMQRNNGSQQAPPVSVPPAE